MLNIYRDSDNQSVARKKQIDTLKIFNANVSEIQENVEYKVEFISGSKPFALFVNLSPEFPMEKPVLHIMPPVSHQWVSESGEITSAPGLLNFTVYSDLGRVVQAIVREFELRPPPPLHPEDASPPSCGSRSTLETGIGSSSGGPPMSPNSYVYSTSSSQTGKFHEYSSQQPSNSHFNNVSVIFPDLNKLSLAELKKLNSSDDRLDEFLESTPAVRELNRTREDWITRVEEISKENLSKEPLLSQAVNDIEEQKVEFSQLKSRFDTLSTTYQKLADRYSPRSIRESLQSAVVKSDERSEQIAEQFLNGQLDLESFLVAYGQRRMLSHCRKTKEEKLSNQLMELDKASF